MSTANSGLKLNEYNMRCPTFIPVSGTGYKLGDIKLTGVTEDGNSRVIFLNDGGATLKITPEMVGQDCYDAYKDADAVFKYYPSEGEYQGWYLGDDWDNSLFKLDDIVKIDPGHGFLIDVQDANANMQFAGQVDEGDEGEIALPHKFGEYNTLGNVTPKDIKIGDIVLDNVSEDGNSRLIFLNDGGATLKVTPEMVGQDCYNDYPNADAVFKFYPGDGWYLGDDWDEGKYLLNTVVPIPAGQAFLFDAQDSGSVVTIPSALKQ